MLLKDEVELLRRLPLFSQVEPARLKLLAFSSNRLRFEAGQILFRQGDAGDAAYVILSGTADILVGGNGDDAKVATVDPGAIVGEIAILCDVPRTATVRAASQLDTLQIKKERFWWLISEFPEISIEIMRVLATRLNLRTAELAEARNALTARTP